MKRRALILNSIFSSVFFYRHVQVFLGGPGWTTLIDGGNGLDNWNVIGDANWRVQDGAIVADKGTAGFLVSKNSYKDFSIYAEFWAATDTNSGIFIRITDPKKLQPTALMKSTSGTFGLNRATELVRL